ncbi:Bifunctional purine biosynthetic protein ade1 [Sticta canariensis]|nr:Bifunctional purine biosynthetic protein ade1 [Sticta canariensis]
MNSETPILRTDLRNYIPLIASGKVREIYELDKSTLLFVTTDRISVEAIVRGYITGSAWKEYSEKGTVHGMELAGPNGRKLVESERMEKPVYTPSTKAEVGANDENIHPDRAADIVGLKYAQRIEKLSLEIYEKAASYALTCGIIIADTKFEFGLDESTDEIVLIDEVLTPDSSRFWPASSYKVGGPQESFDKQYLRDWLTRNGLKGKEDVELPEDVVKKTGEKYREAYEKLAKRALDHTVNSE